MPKKKTPADLLKENRDELAALKEKLSSGAPGAARLIAEADRACKQRIRELMQMPAGVPALRQKLSAPETQQAATPTAQRPAREPVAEPTASPVGSEADWVAQLALDLFRRVAELEATVAHLVELRAPVASSKKKGKAN